MELFQSPYIALPLILIASFCGVCAPLILPFFIKEEFKHHFDSRIDVWTAPYIYQSKWFTRTGVLLQRLFLLIWVPAILYGIYWIFSGGMDGLTI